MPEGSDQRVAALQLMCKILSYKCSMTSAFPSLGDWGDRRGKEGGGREGICPLEKEVS